MLSFHRVALTALIFVGFYTQGTLSQDLPMSPILETLMRCKEPFKPATVIKLLQDNGYISRTPISYIDGIPSFPAIKPLVVFGLQVRVVEAWDFSGGSFKRGPGTAPPIHIALGFERSYGLSIEDRMPKEILEYDRKRKTFAYTTDADKSVNKYPMLTCSQ